MRLEPDDLRHLTAAQGFLELGMPLEANEELEEIDPEVRHVPEDLVVRLGIYHALERWDLIRTVAGKLWEFDPDQPRWALAQAVAARNGESLESARVILGEDVARRPDSALLWYNLAVVECQIGNVKDAQSSLRRAFAIDPKLRNDALEDDDLDPLWNLI
jgi:tetratricopeptide (TPR) repeat protein